MAVIYKYPLSSPTNNTVELPIGSTVLSVQSQDGVLTMWAMHGQQENKTDVLFMIVGTGEEFELDNWKYISTVQSGAFVWHVFVRE